MTWNTPPLNPSDLVLIVLIVGAVYVDVRESRIPNKLTFPCMAAGALLSVFWAPHWYDPGMGFVVAAVASIAFWRLIPNSLMAGDVKMLMAAGTVLGPEAALRAVLFSVLLTPITGIPYLIWKGRFGRRMLDVVKNKAEATRMPHGPVVAVAIVLARLQAWPDLWK